MKVQDYLDQSKASSLTRRYGKQAAPDVGPWNEHIDLLLSHRSVRSYRPDALPDGTLETMVAAAQSAATSSNLQTWSVVAITNPATKSRLARLANGQKHIEQCPLFMVWLADISRNERLGAEEGVDLETLPYFETFLVAAIDAALAAQNAVIAAESLGLSTVYIGALRNDPLSVREVLDLPDRAMGVFGLCVGYAATDAVAEVKPRLPQATVLHRERYGSADEQGLRAAYDNTMETFSERNGMAQTNWTSRVVDRMGKVAAMSGRDNLVAILRSMGFGLR